MESLSTLVGAEKLRAGLLAGGPGSGCDPQEAEKHGKHCGRPKGTDKVVKKAKKAAKKKKAADAPARLAQLLKRDKHPSKVRKFKLIPGRKSKEEVKEAKRKVRILRGVESQLKKVGEGGDFLEIVRENVQDGLEYAWENIGRAIITPAFVDALILAERSRRKAEWPKALAWTTAAVGLLSLQGGWWAGPVASVGAKVSKVALKLGKPISLKGLKLLAKYNKQFRIAVRQSKSKAARGFKKIIRRAPKIVPGGAIRRRRGGTIIRAPMGRYI